MLWTGWICLVPVRWLLPVVNAVERFRTPLARLRIGPRWAAAAALLSVSSSLLFWSCEELPGLGLASLVFAGAWLASARRRAPDALERRVALNLLPALAVVTLLCTLALSHTRFDYYRRAAGELSRMSQLEAALELYRRAERHAPSGQSRMTKIRELEQRLDERPPR
jgi:signal transduction histidine kinase